MERISYTNKATIPSGLPYSNTSPCYTMTREFEDHLTLEVLDVELQDIKSYVDGLILRDFKVYTDFLKQQACDHRFTTINDVKTPHVTSIITPDRPQIPFIEEHAYLGTELDTLIKGFMDTKVWNYPELKPTPNIKVTFKDLYDLIIEWFGKYPEVDLMEHSKKVHNEEFCYCGELDALGYYDKCFTIFDFKKTKTITKPLRTKYFMQMAAYAKCLKAKPSLMCIVSPFNEPVIEGDLDKYFNKFLLARGKYLERYSI